MKNAKTTGTNGSGGGEYRRFAAKRVAAGILITALVIWMASLIFGFFEKEPHATTAKVGHVEDVKKASHSAGPDSLPQAGSQHAETAADSHVAAGDDDVDRYKKLFERRVASQDVQMAAEHSDKPAAPAAQGVSHTAETDDSHAQAPAEPQHEKATAEHGQPPVATHHPEPPAEHAQTAPAPQHATTVTGHAQPIAAAQHDTAAAGSGHKESKSDSHATAAIPHEPEPHQAPAAAAPHGQAPEKETHAASSQDTHAAPPVVHKALGVAFVEALIYPLDYEINERFWGWRPNDIINITDNVNSFQLGVLEVTRRTSIILTERISRIGGAASFDTNMEQAMNWFMIKPSRYWLPSPEVKYNEGLDNLRQYAKALEDGTARFYTRTDNLIPLLLVYQDLLGSCDENLVKAKEDNGEEVSFFKADDYFFYAKGVASAMMGILEAIHHEFNSVLETRKARDALHHAVESLHHATAISPWIVLNRDLSSIFANHRANMAAPISHARFYLGVAIGALST